MTEEEARQKWCPMTRATMSDTPVEGNTALNVFPEGALGFDACKCIASDCMMWHWTAEPFPEADIVGYGYCGLARRP